MARRQLGHQLMHLAGSSAQSNVRLPVVLPLAGAALERHTASALKRCHLRAADWKEIWPQLAMVMPDPLATANREACKAYALS